MKLHFFSGRNKSKEIFQNSQKFSVIYKIINHIIPNSIPCGINIQNESVYPEKELYFNLFLFIMLKMSSLIMKII